MTRERLEGLRAVRVEVEQAGELLRFPTREALNQCMPILENARRELARFREKARHCGDKGDALREAGLLQAAIHKVQVLLQSAWDYQTQWNRNLPMVDVGYAPTGEAAGVRRSAGFSLSG